MILKYFKLLYFLVLFGVLIFSEVNFFRTGSYEVGIFLIWVTAVLTFPLGLLLPGVLSIIGSLGFFDGASGPGPLWQGMLYLFAIWLGMILGAWAQWFVLLPKGIAKFKNWRAKKQI